MAIEDLKHNIKIEKNLIREIIVSNSLSYENITEEKRLQDNLLKQLKIVNNSIPAILDSISPYKKLGKEEKKAEDLIRISYIPETEKKERVFVTVGKHDRERFLKELSLGNETIKRLKRESRIKEVIKESFMIGKPNFYARLANRFFLNSSNNFIKEGKLKRLNSFLRKANMSYLVTTYFSIVLFSTLLAFFLGVIIYVFLLFFSFSSSFSFIEVSEVTLISAVEKFLVVILLPLVTFLSLYFYPYVEGKGIEGKINQELPFVTIHMSAIAGSGIEPTQIFKIIVLGEEYPYIKKEFRKIINQVNIYGYDIITALKNTARETSSRKMSELLNGVATTISSGGELGEFLDKRAETLLFDYKLERERHTKSAETFMDIYISIVIAAPMIMTLLLVLIAMSGIGIGISLNQLTIIIISVISLINILFLIFLHLSQLSY